MKHLAAMGNRPLFKVKSSMNGYIYTHTGIYIYMYSIYVYIYIYRCIYIYIQCVYIYIQCIYIYTHTVYIYIYTHTYSVYIYIYTAVCIYIEQAFFNKGFCRFSNPIVCCTVLRPGSPLPLRQAEFQIFERKMCRKHQNFA